MQVDGFGESHNEYLGQNYSGYNRIHWAHFSKPPNEFTTTVRYDGKF